MSGRVFERGVRAGFADCAPSGRARLDCVARWLADVAYADVEEAGLAGAAVWVLRRTRVRVRRWPRFSEPLGATTFCSGLGRMWAERSTTLSRPGAEQADVDAVALWVHLDPESWRPLPLSEAEISLYGPSAAGRRVTARLHHPQPPSGEGAPWTFRATELDIAAHINNSAYWAPFEQELIGGPEPERLDAEIEFRAPAQPGEKVVVGDGGPLRSGAMRWIAGADGELHASLLITDIG